MGKPWIYLLSGISLAILGLGCGYFSRWQPRQNPPYSYPSELSFSSNGERIYFTATNQAGQAIGYTGGPGYGGMMMGAFLTCAGCHGPDGRGGRHVMHMWAMDAPPINYASLNSMMEESHGGSMPGGYSLDDFRLAVVEGKHPDGEELNPNMPRWQLADQDLQDLFEFIKTFP